MNNIKTKIHNEILLVIKLVFKKLMKFQKGPPIFSIQEIYTQIFLRGKNHKQIKGIIFIIQAGIYNIVSNSLLSNKIDNERKRLLRRSIVQNLKNSQNIGMRLFLHNSNPSKLNFNIQDHKHIQRPLLIYSPLIIPPQ